MSVSFIEAIFFFKGCETGERKCLNNGDEWGESGANSCYSKKCVAKLSKSGRKMDLRIKQLSSKKEKQISTIVYLDIPLNECTYNKAVYHQMYNSMAPCNKRAAFRIVKKVYFNDI